MLVIVSVFIIWARQLLCRSSYTPCLPASDHHMTSVNSLGKKTLIASKGNTPNCNLKSLLFIYICYKTRTSTFGISTGVSCNWMIPNCSFFFFFFFKIVTQYRIVIVNPQDLVWQHVVCKTPKRKQTWTKERFLTFLLESKFTKTRPT